MSTNPIKNGAPAPYMKKPMNTNIMPNTQNKMMDQRNGGGANGGKMMRSKEDDKALSNRKVFVGGLPSNATKDNLVEYFSKFGGVEDANIKMDMATGRSRGYGFVLFESKEVADSVLSSSEHVIMGKQVDVKTAKYKGTPPVKKVFIGGLDPNFPETELREYFSKFGKIEEIELPFDKQKNQRRSFCFILFETEESVNEVLKKPKHVLGGKEVDVKKATPPKDQNQQNALLQPQWNMAAQNWNMPNNQYFAGGDQGGYGGANYGAGLYNAPGSFGGAPHGAAAPAAAAAAAAGYGKYNYNQQPNYPVGYNENIEAGYVDYDDPTASAYDYASGNMPPGGAYDQSGFYQNGQMGGSYDQYGYDQGLYGNYGAPTDQFSAPPAQSIPSKGGHHSYGKSMSKRSSQSSQSYHPYNR